MHGTSAPPPGATRAQARALASKIAGFSRRLPAGASRRLVGDIIGGIAEHPDSFDPILSALCAYLDAVHAPPKLAGNVVSIHSGER